MSDPEPMDVAGCIKAINAIPLQHRSVLLFTHTAGSVSGLSFVGLAQRCWAYAEAELSDLRRLVEKVVALGGEAATAIAPFDATTDADATTRALVAAEREAIAALHEVIPLTGQEPRSEALEHLVEHLIIRKQEQLDQLLRALGETE